MQNKNITTSCLTVLLLLLLTPQVQAQAMRTFVSGSGNDTNGCSIAAPCRSFQRAHDVTLAGGEIVPLDSGGYGPVVISKSISISAPDGVYAGITVTTSNGIGVQINTAGVKVSLRGISLTGPGPTIFMHTSKGVVLQAGDSLYLDRCQIRGFSAGLFLYVGNTVMTDCRVMENNFAATAMDGSLTMERCSFAANSFGFQVVGGTHTARNSVFSGGTEAIHANGTAKIAILDSTITGCQTGVGSWNAASVAMITNTALIGNQTALAGTGQILTRDPHTNTIEWSSVAAGSTTGTYPAK